MTALLPDDIDVLADALIKKSMMLLDAEDPELMKKMVMIAVEDTQLTVDGTVTMKEWQAFLVDEIEADAEADVDVEEKAGYVPTGREIFVSIIVIFLAAYGVYEILIGQIR